MEALWQSDKHGYPRFESYQPQYSLMERAGFELEAQPLCRHHQLGVIPIPHGRRIPHREIPSREPPLLGARVKEMSENYLNERGWASSMH